ncbi:HipA N-terminal domain-containing protein [Mycobacteroides abscessus subsp. abscessus]|uniref:HipA domain-containing protein n=1 Tax=Mycobacteroides abscessus TaxID=36809 RepID=UPI00092BA0B2|nr:HipA domain-containing protein [Mycobacteroides abscessus]SHY07569.1 HipA N-terminal domain-containing protein [Mycobacteroides abscessus subsp. abscessus]SIC75079.1 HipA N-terminal domain-containing protein [Mycobacteroides abscessus subsp. abscessus]SKP28619.1 HipA N-terminal domain-containing protein [Mycobacteroides abscessus subsp. abscessus]
MNTAAQIVIVNGKVAGAITYGHGPQFTYTDAYVDAESTPLSLSMPVRSDHTYGHHLVGPWLAGLLPNTTAARPSTGNHANALQVPGRDCAGAVQFAGVDDLEDVLGGRGCSAAATDSLIGERIRQLHQTPYPWTQPGEHWTLAGHQPKFVLTSTGSGWAFPMGSATSTHIVKPAFNTLAINEYLCQNALAAIGFPTATTVYHEFDGEPAIVTTRYDRATTRTGVRRIHQEDLCQALSVWPYNKFPANGGPSAVSIARLLGRHAEQVDVDRFCDSVIARYLLGDTDGHAKKYSIVLAADDAALAPLYGTTSMLPYRINPAKGPRRLAAPIGAHTYLDGLTYRHIERFAVDAGSDPDRLIEAAARMAGQLPDAVDEAARTLPGTHHGFAAYLRDTITRHCTALTTGRTRAATAS